MHPSNSVTSQSGPNGHGHGNPGEALQRLFMQPLGLSAYRLSMDLGVAPIAVSQILRGRRSISAAMALRLGNYFGVEPGFWLALQGAYDLQLAAQELAAAAANGQNGVLRCAALDGRSLVVKETHQNGLRRWEVLMVSSPDAPAAKKQNQGTKPEKTKAASRPVAKKKTKALARR
jgi:addiction module HigA family antidote